MAPATKATKPTKTTEVKTKEPVITPAKEPVVKAPVVKAPAAKPAAKAVKEAPVDAEYTETEPVVETTESLAELFTKLGEVHKKFVELERERVNLVKAIQRGVNVVNRQLSKKSKRSGTKNGQRSQTGFRSPKEVPEQFVEFINSHKLVYDKSDDKLHYVDEKGEKHTIVDVDANGNVNLDANKQYPRTLITHLLYDYIDQNGLKSGKEEGGGRYIKVDKDLRKLFQMGKVEEVPVDKKTGKPKLNSKGETIKKGDDEELEFGNFQTFMSRVYKNVATTE